MRITTPYGTLLVDEQTRIPLTITNPMFSNEGSHSLPFTVPWCEHNLAALGHPENAHRANNQPNFIDAVVELQGFNQKGVLSLVDLAKDESIELSYLTREGAFWKYAKGINLRDTINFKSAFDWYASRNSVFTGGYPDQIFAIFPLVLGVSSNVAENFYIVNDIYPLIDSQAEYDVYTNKPALGGYLYVSFVFNFIFREVGYRITDSVFLDDPELEKAVVLNNYLFEFDNPLFPDQLMYDIQKMLPNCTVAEFMEAIEMEFGVVFDIDYQNGEVSIKQVKERILNANVVRIDGDITSVMQQKKGFELTNETVESPYSLSSEDFIRNLDLDSVDVVAGGIVDDEPITTATTPNRSTYPEKYIFCTANQTFYRLEWIQNEAESNWEYIPKSVHSYFSDTLNFTLSEKAQRSSKAHSAPMVPNRVSNVHGWRPMGFPFYGKSFNPNYLFRSDSLNMKNYVINDNATTPISFAFYRGVIQFNLDEGTWGEAYWDLPYGSTDFYTQDDGSEYGSFNYALRHNGLKGIVENWYSEYKKLVEEIGVRFKLIHSNQHKEIMKNITGKFLCQNIPFFVEKMEITLSGSGIRIESIDCISTKPLLED